MPLSDEERERRAIEEGERRANDRRRQEEHDEILKFVRDYRGVLDKIYASKMTETIVNTVLKVVFLAVLGAGLALVITKR